ncbi:unnamed protein product [Ceutorhynchus assimilis]|uniref:Uncharacterized protein n=1 Tax=Ceutorhynchus assimilis TaxID=467358 RepID=A0A9N9MJH9_9CUCU|nr:unnamed protein product [Ceutorhynchus assimilis]
MSEHPQLNTGKFTNEFTFKKAKDGTTGKMLPRQKMPPIEEVRIERGAVSHQFMYWNPVQIEGLPALEPITEFNFDKIELDASPRNQGQAHKAVSSKTCAAAGTLPVQAATSQRPRQKEEGDINLIQNRDENVNININDDGFEFQRTQRKRQYRKKRLGNAKISPESQQNGFAGGDRKAWLYLNRIKRQTTEEMIINYVKGKKVLNTKT